jgi:hypothetical protein
VPVDIGPELKDKGKAFLNMLGGRVADVETHLRRGRQPTWIMTAT